MALRGTLKDFGIAEIFQLIGGQGKSGVLYLESKKDKLKLLFEGGAIAGVEIAGANRKGSLPDLLVRAELLTAAQAKEASAIQKKTLRRLQDIIKDQGWLEADVLQEMTALETNEALYGLFTWQEGTYRFEPGEVQYDEATVKPRALEHFLMEGFRRVDEWPIIRRRIGSYDTAFEVVAPLPEERVDDIGKHERRIWSLVAPDRDLSKLIDLSRMGEFEACRAVQHLIDTGYIRPVSRPKQRRKERQPGARPQTVIDLETVAKGFLALAVIGLLFFLVFYANPDLSGLLRAPPNATIGRTDLRSILGNAQHERLREAVQVYRLERGVDPESLDRLVSAGLITESELRYPWEQRYALKDGVVYRPIR